MDDWKEMIFFMTSSLTANMSMYKSFLFDSPAMKTLIKDAIFHDSAVQNADSKLKHNLAEHGKVCWQFLMVYIICAFGILFSLYAGSIILYMISLNCDSTVDECKRSLAWPSVSIFSLESQYGVSLIVNSIGMTFLGGFVLVGNITLASVCIFPTFKLKHLQYVLTNFQYYGEILSKSENIPIRNAEYFIIRECVIEHQRIIRDFEKLKESTKVLFLLDFITHAMQTAPYLLIIMAYDGNIDYLITMTVSCMAFVIFELFMVYWFAQGVIDESINVGTCIGLSNWYEADVRTLKLLQLLMIRSIHRLALRVGPFYDMELNIFLKICKMMYTVVTVFKRQL
ncbi:uncharacterized protein LOC123318370 [Coccinella septempunctata]|uniref:uncharacterized protein LOC123318370 n=1 Tax=Coccinella septempunctata TaxID=41139 RepID=UPI001D08A519|nr:uncharacterized protein LOC123318370 [Coccinella septempunctata]